jgi:hypothetical protein
VSWFLIYPTQSTKTKIDGDKRKSEIDLNNILVMVVVVAFAVVTVHCGSNWWEPTFTLKTQWSDNSKRNVSKLYQNSLGLEKRNHEKHGDLLTILYTFAQQTATTTWEAHDIETGKEAENSIRTHATPQFVTQTGIVLFDRTGANKRRIGNGRIMHWWKIWCVSGRLIGGGCRNGTACKLVLCF